MQPTVAPPRSPLPSPTADQSSRRRPRIRWLPAAPITPAERQLAATCQVDPTLAAILARRGLNTPETLCDYVSPGREKLRDPFLLPDIEPAIDRLYAAVRGRERVLVFGDYDADGVTATAVAVRALQALGVPAEGRVPEREHGYGLRPEVVEAAANEKFDLILTVDNGITALAAAVRARELGLDLIVTDHHLPGDRLPPALAVVNPCRHDSQYGFRGLCGCAVVFKTLQAMLLRHAPHQAENFYQKFVAMVALATVADCVPLCDENRVLARYGLEQLATTRRVGLKALMESARLRIRDGCVSGYQAGFALAPRLNATGRMKSPTTSLRLLLSTDADECRRLAQELESCNRERQAESSRLFSAALEQVWGEMDPGRDCAVIASGEGWPHGLMGLVAGKLADFFARPALVFSVQGEVAQGSGRSGGGLDLEGMLDAVRDLLTAGGGHPAACGMTLAASRLPELKERVLRYCSDQLQVDELRPEVQPEVRVEESDLTRELPLQLASLEPCGNGNPQALLELCGATITDATALRTGGIKWRLKLEQQFFEALWWQPAEHVEQLTIGSAIDLCFEPRLDVWNGCERLQLEVRHARLSRGS